MSTHTIPPKSKSEGDDPGSSVPNWGNYRFRNAGLEATQGMETPKWAGRRYRVDVLLFLPPGIYKDKKKVSLTACPARLRVGIGSSLIFYFFLFFWFLTTRNGDVGLDSPKLSSDVCINVSTSYSCNARHEQAHEYFFVVYIHIE